MLSAFELMPRIALEFVLRHIEGARDPLGAPSPWYVLMEATGGRHANLAASFEDGLAAAITDGLATDAVVASSAAQAQSLWKLRESISESQKREGASIKHDIAVPVADGQPILLAQVHIGFVSPDQACSRRYRCHGHACPPIIGLFGAW